MNCRTINRFQVKAEIIPCFRPVQPRFCCPAIQRRGSTMSIRSCVRTNISHSFQCLE